MDNLLKFTKLNSDIGLQSYLEVYDTMAEANFTPFSLVETLDYEYFYEEDLKKDEALILQDITTGASNDIERATEIARNMITRYGMSEKFGPIQFGDSNDEIFLGRD